MPSINTNITVNLGLEPNPNWNWVIFPTDLMDRLQEDGRYRTLGTLAGRQKIINSMSAIAAQTNLPHEVWVALVRNFSSSAREFANNPNEDTFMEALHGYGYGCPEAFFDEVQTRCPVTGEDLESMVHLNWAKFNRFAYSPNHQIIESGWVIDTLNHSVVECCEIYTPDIRANDWYMAHQTTRWNGRLFPTDWLENNTGWCANCERRRWSHDLVYDEDSDQHLCENEDDCGYSAPAPRCHLLDYNDPTANRLPSQSPRGRRMGLEIEWLYGPSFLDANDCPEWRNSREVRRCVEEAAHQILSSLPVNNYAILKRDGSLRVEGLDVGLEFVTRPERLPVHREILTALWGKLPSGLLSSYRLNGYEVPIGLHIHAERWGRSLLHQAKVYYFMSLTSNRSWIVDIAQRLDERYARFPARASWQHIHGTFLNGRSDCSHNPGKYVALRILPDTLEFRIFRSHTELSGVLRCMEFVEALFDFTKFASARELQATRFVKFINANRKAYPCLHDYVSPENRTK